MRRKPSDVKRMSDATLSRYALDLADEVASLSAALRLAKREQRARKAKGKKRKAQRAACGKPAPVPALWAYRVPGSLH